MMRFTSWPVCLRRTVPRFLETDWPFSVGLRTLFDKSQTARRPFVLGDRIDLA